MGEYHPALEPNQIDLVGELSKKEELIKYINNVHGLFKNIQVG